MMCCFLVLFLLMCFAATLALGSALPALFWSERNNSQGGRRGGQENHTVAVATYAAHET